MAFMRPSVQFLSHAEAIEYCDDSDNPLMSGNENCSGYYSRLSAPGYLDCTEWLGPFKTEAEALAYVMDAFEVDENGESLLD